MRWQSLQLRSGPIVGQGNLIIEGNMALVLMPLLDGLTCPLVFRVIAPLYRRKSQL